MVVCVHQKFTCAKNNSLRQAPLTEAPHRQTVQAGNHPPPPCPIHMEAITSPWEFTSAGRLITAVGRRVNDGNLVYVDTTGSWCSQDGMYQVPGRPRPLQHSALLDKELKVPQSMYNFLFDTTDASLHVKLGNGTVLVPMLSVSPDNGPVCYLSPKGKVVNECGMTSITWNDERHALNANRGPEPPKLKPLPRSIRASRIKAIGCLQLRKATVVSTPTITSIRKLQAAFGNKRTHSTKSV